MVPRKTEIGLVDTIDPQGKLRRGVAFDHVVNARAVLLHNWWIRLPLAGSFLRAHWAKKHGAQIDPFDGA